MKYRVKAVTPVGEFYSEQTDDREALHIALANSKKFGRSSYVSVGKITDLGNGKMEVEKICHIGD